MFAIQNLCSSDTLAAVKQGKKHFKSIKLCSFYFHFLKSCYQPVTKTFIFINFTSYLYITPSIFCAQTCNDSFMSNTPCMNNCQKTVLHIIHCLFECSEFQNIRETGFSVCTDFLSCEVWKWNKADQYVAFLPCLVFLIILNLIIKQLLCLI